ncbi:MAG: hypothetical protein ACOCWZ_10875 [Spirochaetota bacterium]
MKSCKWIGVIIILVLFVSCGGSRFQNSRVEEDKASEDVMVRYLAEKIHAKHEILKGKKIAVTHFMSLDGQEVPEGKRISRKLLEDLIDKGDMQFVERADMADIIKIKEIELSGLVDEDGEAAQNSLVPVDVVIGGTIAGTGKSAELFVKVTDIKTGEIYLAISRNFMPEDGLSYSDDNEKIRIHKSNPEVFEKINTTYRLLMDISERRPVVFLLVVMEKRDPLIRQNREAARILRTAVQRLRRNNPEKLRKLGKLRKDAALIKKYDPRRYQDIINVKEKILTEKLNR